VQVDKLELIPSEREVVSYDIEPTTRNVDTVCPSFFLYKVHLSMLPSDS